MEPLSEFITITLVICMLSLGAIYAESKKALYSLLVAEWIVGIVYIHYLSVSGLAVIFILWIYIFYKQKQQDNTSETPAVIFQPIDWGSISTAETLMLASCTAIVSHLFTKWILVCD
jgi:hypothetical protein